MINAQQASDIILRRLSPRRYQHSLDVARTAADLADHYGVDRDKSYLTGILHDYAKDLKPAELLHIAGENGLIDCEVERQVPDLLHAPVGACLLQKELGVEDPEILKAVRAHTMGSLTMSTLDKIIFLADMIEPGRNQYPDLEYLRRLVFVDLDQAMLLGLDSTIRYCLDRRALLHPLTIEVRNIYLQKIKGRQPES